MFNQAKVYDVTITEAYLAEPKFENSAYDVAIKVETEEGESDFYTMEISSNYGRGNYATMTQAEIALKKLKELGLQVETLEDALFNLDALIGIKTTATVKETNKDGKIYHNISYLGGGFAPKKVDPKEAMNKLSALFGGAKSAPVSAAKANPFL